MFPPRLQDLAGIFFSVKAYSVGGFNKEFALQYLA